MNVVVVMIAIAISFGANASGILYSQSAPLEKMSETRARELFGTLAERDLANMVGEAGCMQRAVLNCELLEKLGARNCRLIAAEANGGHFSPDLDFVPPGIDWQTHVAAIVDDWVFDPLLFNRPVDIGRWLLRIDFDRDFVKKEKDDVIFRNSFQIKDHWSESIDKSTAVNEAEQYIQTRLAPEDARRKRVYEELSSLFGPIATKQQIDSMFNKTLAIEGQYCGLEKCAPFNDDGVVEHGLKIFAQLRRQKPHTALKDLLEIGLNASSGFEDWRNRVFSIALLWGVVKFESAQEKGKLLKWLAGAPERGFSTPLYDFYTQIAIDLTPASRRSLDRAGLTQ